MVAPSSPTNSAIPIDPPWVTTSYTAGRVIIITGTVTAVSIAVVVACAIFRARLVKRRRAALGLPVATRRRRIGEEVEEEEEEEIIGEKPELWETVLDAQGGRCTPAMWKEFRVGRSSKPKITRNSRHALFPVASVGSKSPYIPITIRPQQAESL